MDVITDHDLDFIEELVAEGIAIPAIIVSALLERVRACSCRTLPEAP
jgi:hypothetical protein